MGMVNHKEILTFAVLKVTMGGRLMLCSHRANGVTSSTRLFRQLPGIIEYITAHDDQDGHKGKADIEVGAGLPQFFRTHS